jgi:hypothetical protein
LLGSERLRKTISGRKIAYLFTLISEGNIIRTTPKSSPLSSQLPSPSNKKSSAILKHGTTSDVAVRGAYGNSTLAPLNENDESERRRSTSRPPPILRKPGLEQLTTTKQARILTPTQPSAPRSNSPQKRILRGISAESSTKNSISPLSQTSSDAVSQESTSPEQDPGSFSTTVASSTNKPSKKRTAFAVSSKRRPSMPRRKSSQSQSSASASKAVSPRIPGIQSSQRTDAQQRAVSQKDKELLPNPQASSTKSGKQPSTSGSSGSIKTVRNLSDDRNDQPPKPEPAPLVESNFRTLFNNKAPTTNSRLRDLPVKSTLATGHATSYQATGSLTAFGEEEDSLKVSSNTKGKQEQAQNTPALSRSKSQLTMLLEGDEKKGDSSSKARRKDSKAGNKTSKK